MNDNTKANSILMDCCNEERILIRRRFAWLQSLMIAILADEDIHEGFPVFYLAEMGEYMAEMWISEMDQKL
jgi:hypothetical protein